MIALSCCVKFRLREKYIKILGIYALTSLLFILFQQVSIHMFNNVGVNAIGSGFVLFEALLFGQLYFSVAKSQNYKRIIFTSIIIYILFYCVLVIFYQENYYSLIRWGRDLLMIILALGYFYYLLRKQPEENLFKFPLFWINAAIIFFFSGTFVLSFLLDYMHRVLESNFPGFWAFRNFFRFGFCLVLAYAGWLDLQLIKASRSS
jgi:hypothetical protein